MELRIRTSKSGCKICAYFSIAWYLPLRKLKRMIEMHLRYCSINSSTCIKETKSLEPEVGKADIQYTCCKIDTPPSCGWRDISDH